MVFWFWEVGGTIFASTMTPFSSIEYRWYNMLYHRYSMDENGVIVDAKIVPPTSQNQKTIENDLRDYVTPRVNTPTDQLRTECEHVIRNYDPCISCSVHFLKLDITKEGTAI